MHDLIQADVSSIDPNPHRGKPKFIENKVETLMRSIADVELWPSLVARPVGNRFQLAFHHHTFEAARRSGLKRVPLIVRPISDEMMLAMLGRENLEDFNADLLTLLETWNAAVRFSARARENPQAIDAARLLGWTQVHSKTGTDQLNHTARVCDGARRLIEGRHLTLDDLEGLSVKAALDLVERVLGRIEMLDKLGKKGGRPVKEIEADKKHVAGAARSVARDYRAGTIAKSNIKQEIDYRAVKTATKKDRPSPLFAAFAKDVAESIHKMLVGDLAAEKLSEMERALPLVTMEEDRLALRRIDFALAEHEETTGNWRRRLAAKGEKVVPFKMLTKEDRSA